MWKRNVKRLRDGMVYSLWYGIEFNVTLDTRFT